MNDPIYSCIDAALMKQIRQGKGSRINIFIKAKHLVVLAEPCRTEDAWAGRSTAKQVIESRLQALNGIGLIAWNGARWCLT